MYLFYGIIAVGVILLFLVVYLLYKYDKELLINLAYQACTDAENALGSGKGEEKYNIAFTQITEKLPFLSSIFISEPVIKYAIEKVALPVLQAIFKKASAKIETSKKKKTTK